MSLTTNQNLWELAVGIIYLYINHSAYPSVWCTIKANKIWIIAEQNVSTYWKSHGEWSDRILKQNSEKRHWFNRAQCRLISTHHSDQILGPLRKACCLTLVYQHSLCFDHSVVLDYMWQMSSSSPTPSITPTHSQLWAGQLAQK